MRYWEGDEINDAPDGMYLCYVNNEFINTYADRLLLVKSKDGFYHRGSDVRYRDTVYGGYGPVPHMELF